MTSNIQENHWKWEEPNPLRSGTSGNLAKLFRNETIKQPGLLANDAPPPTATTMARELIQNSWDAATELRRVRDQQGQSTPQFEIEFRYLTYSGNRKSELIGVLGLESLRRHLPEGNRRALGINEENCLDHLGDSKPLRILQVIERGASGMYGPFTGAHSKLYLALISLGYTKKLDGAGGSFGFGKAGLIRGSAIHSLVAYTCFQEQPNDVGVTRRLLGMTYWGEHEQHGSSFNGFARLGVEQNGSAVPYENETADQLARQFDIDLRSPSEIRQLGTTFLVIEPNVEPEHLCAAIERNWWPALIDNSFVVTITKEDGTNIFPKPKRNPTLSWFVRAYDLAVTPQDNSKAEEHSRNLGTTTALPNAGSVGSIGLVANLDGWSYGVTVDENELLELGDAGSSYSPDKSLVALVRGPRMVVEYLETGSQPPFVRGVFVADPIVDDLLRQSEPMAHDSWQTDATEEGIDPAAPKVAKSVLTKIKAEVAAFRKKLKPPLPREEDIYLPMLQDLFHKLLDGRGPSAPVPPPPPEMRQISIRLEQELELADEPGMVRLRANAWFSLAEVCESESELAHIELRYQFVEDGRSGESCPAAIDAPQEFKGIDGGEFVGLLSHEPAQFVLISDPYPNEWSGRLVAEGKLASAHAIAETDSKEVVR